MCQFVGHENKTVEFVWARTPGCDIRTCQFVGTVCHAEGALAGHKASKSALYFLRSSLFRSSTRSAK